MKIEKFSEDEGVITVTEEDYKQQLSRGLAEEEVLKPGQHKFIRGGFQKRHPGFDPSKIEIRYTVTLSLPPEVYDYFAAKTGEEGAGTCADVIQNLLITIAEKDLGKAEAVTPAPDVLLKNPQFIQAVADRVKKKLAKKPAAAKSSSTTKSRRRAA